MFDELSIVNQLSDAFPQYIGDDAAILPIDAEHSWVISKDLLIEDIHFRARYQTAESLAHKALHVNLSDIAAMGVQPEYALLGISIPPQHDAYAKQFLSEFCAACQREKVILIGGDTTPAIERLSLSVTVMGKAKNHQVKTRNQAKPGDVLCVAGNIGDAHLGFTALENNTPGLETFKKVFLNPIARVDEGVWLGEQMGVTAMMDLSDGLAIDIPKLCRASNVSAELDLSSIEKTENFMNACQQLGLDPEEAQRNGGEDYSLLLAIDAACIADIQTQFKMTFGYSFKCIGRIILESPVRYSFQKHA
ncbi:MAG: thiamine-monophosphate kinase [marine bacterium B5-7]|nr:MAG: thiamine-monophosphate kinase [marine bacterium B5-7]